MSNICLWVSRFSKICTVFLQATKGLLVYPENAVYVGMFTVQYIMVQEYTNINRTMTHRLMTFGKTANVFKLTEVKQKCISATQSVELVRMFYI